MPSKVEYPHASMKQSMEFAKAVDELGGSSSVEMCAEKLGKKVSGAFRNIVSSAVKYGFVTAKRACPVQTTQAYKDIKLSYNETEKKQLMRKAFLTISLFKNVCDRFNNQKLPIEFFDKLLIKEFDVKESHAATVKGLFISGARSVDLLTADNTLCCDSEPSEKDTGGCPDNEVGQLPVSSPSLTHSIPSTANAISISSSANIKRSTLPLDNTDGLVIVEWPKEISKEDYDDISDWLEILKRKIERSIVAEIKNELPNDE